MFNSRHVKFALTFTLIFAIVLSCLTVVNARRSDDLIPVFDFVNGMDRDIEPLKYYNKDLSITGKASEGTQVNIRSYWYSPNNHRTIIYKDKHASVDTASGQWILEESHSFTVGISGIFGVSVSVRPGRNKILVGSDNGVCYELEVEYIDNEEIVKKVNTIFFKDLDLELIY